MNRAANAAGRLEAALKAAGVANITPAASQIIRDAFMAYNDEIVRDVGVMLDEIASKTLGSPGGGKKQTKPEGRT